MSRNPLFSTYRQGENRVTASMLAEQAAMEALDEQSQRFTGESAESMKVRVR